MTSFSPSLALLLCVMSCVDTNAWRNNGHVFGICRGGSSTTTLEEKVLLDSFQEEVHKMRQEMQQETDSLVDNLRREIIEAKQKAKRARAKAKKASSIKKEEDASTEANVEEQDADAAVPLSNVEDFSLEQDFSDGLDDDLAPEQDGERIAVFEETDDFLVGESDEEPEAVLHRMKEKDSALKLDDVLGEKGEQEEEGEEKVSHDILSNLPSGKKAASTLMPKRKKKKSKKKAKKNLVRPEGSKKKKKSKKKTKLAKEKEAIHTALSAKTMGHQLSLLQSPAMQSVVKAVVLAILLALVLLALKIIENSVTPSATASTVSAK